MNTKAKELVDKFYYALPNNGLQVGVNNVNSRWEEAKKCALIACKEVIKYCERWGDMGVDDIKEQEEIMKEIEKL